MPKYLLLKHNRGGPEPHRTVPPMDEWAPEDVEAHMAFLRHVTELLQANGGYVDAQGLTPARTWVRYGGQDAAAVTTEGPLSSASRPPGAGQRGHRRSRGRARLDVHGRTEVRKELPELPHPECAGRRRSCTTDSRIPSQPALAGAGSFAHANASYGPRSTVGCRPSGSRTARRHFSGNAAWPRICWPVGAGSWRSTSMSARGVGHGSGGSRRRRCWPRPRCRVVVSMWSWSASMSGRSVPIRS